MIWRETATLMAWAGALLLPACAASGAGGPGAVPGAVPGSVSGQGLSEGMGASSSDPRALQAQTTTPQCQPQAAQEALGRKASPELAERARQLAGAATVRVIGHDDMVTKEYLASRLNLDLDEDGVVRKIYCG